MFSAVITVKAIWVFSLPSKKQNISLLSQNSQNKKKKNPQNQQKSFCSPFPWERKREGETPLTFSEGIRDTPAACQVQICPL